MLFFEIKKNENENESKIRLLLRNNKRKIII